MKVAVPVQRCGTGMANDSSRFRREVIVASEPQVIVPFAAQMEMGANGNGWQMEMGGNWSAQHGILP